MGDAEGVVDVGVVAVDQLLDEGRVVRRSSPGSNRRFSSSSTWGARRASSSRTGPRSHWASGRPVGPAQMGAGGDRGPLGQEVLEGGQGGPDAEVVGDHGRLARARVGAAR